MALTMLNQRLARRLCRWSIQQRWNVGFSSRWQGAGGDDRTDPPNPISYLEGFDLVAKDYKKALFEACSIKSGQFVLDVGCGTATSTERIVDTVGPEGVYVGVDQSDELIRRAQVNFRGVPNVQFAVDNVYQLSMASQSFDVVREDRLLQHLQRPLEALQEMVRVARPGGTVIIANPNFYSFTMDIPSQRWGDSRRPSASQGCLSSLTTKVLNGVIPTLCVHPALGIQSPRLLRAAGCTNIELQTVPIELFGLENLERVVPVSYMARLSQANGAISEQERVEWLERLALEENLFGILNMYICRGTKPGVHGSNEVSWRNAIGKRHFANLPEPKLCLDVEIRMASTSDPPELIEQARHLINNEYATSDTGTTLSSVRVRPQDIQEMVTNNELLLAFDEIEDLVGCVQVKMKQQDTSGLPDVGDKDPADVVGEFTCLAVESNVRAKVLNANTQNVVVKRSKRGENRRRSGVGTALVRTAEAHARTQGATRMILGIICPAHGPEPDYKVWLQDYYRKLGYDLKETVMLNFERDTSGNVVVDQLHEMYEPLHQLVQCKAILFDKRI